MLQQDSSKLWSSVDSCDSTNDLELELWGSAKPSNIKIEALQSTILRKITKFLFYVPIWPLTRSSMDFVWTMQVQFHSNPPVGDLSTLTFLAIPANFLKECYLETYFRNRGVDRWHWSPPRIHSHWYLLISITILYMYRYIKWKSNKHKEN